MLAEMFMLRLEAKARDRKEAAAATSSRFVPVTLLGARGGNLVYAGNPHDPLVLDTVKNCDHP
jgi:hypothetical protein